ncbi:MAG TPA: hypothetical protein EYG90_04115 [Campylobacterales bacterium]|nr:hypothetical protein [Campylobacterales bacterium]
METKLLITAISLTLIMSGCADKKVSTLDVADNTAVIDGAGVNGEGTNSYGYDNVDPYGKEYSNSHSGNTNLGNYNDNTLYAETAGGVKNIYFASNQYTITHDKLSTISSNANLLKGAVNSGAKLKIEGHCDATGTDEYNYALGLKRARAVKEAITSRGINPANIVMVSMGESSPECSSSFSSDCYAKNRRVEFKVVQ